MNNDIIQMKADIAELKTTINSLKQSSTIPYDIDKAFVNRGFTKVRMVTGKGSFNVSGEFKLQIPGATKNSPVFISSTDGSALMGATMQLNATSTGYQIYAQGTATKTFYFLVMIDPNYTDYL